MINAAIETTFNKFETLFAITFIFPRQVNKTFVIINNIVNNTTIFLQSNAPTFETKCRQTATLTEPGNRTYSIFLI